MYILIVDFTAKSAQSQLSIRGINHKYLLIGVV